MNYKDVQVVKDNFSFISTTGDYTPRRKNAHKLNYLFFVRGGLDLEICFRFQKQIDDFMKALEAELSKFDRLNSSLAMECLVKAACQIKHLPTQKRVLGILMSYM